MFHSFFYSLARSRYLSFFSLSFRFILWSPRRAKSTILQILFFLLIIMRSGLLTGIRWSVSMLKSHRSLCESFSRTGAGLYIYHSFVWSNWNFLNISQLITLRLNRVSPYTPSVQICCIRLLCDGFHLPSYFQVLQSLYQSFLDLLSAPITVGITVIFMFHSLSLLLKGRVSDLSLIFFFSILPCGQPEQQSLIFGRFFFLGGGLFFFLIISRSGSLAEIRWSVYIYFYVLTVYSLFLCSVSNSFSSMANSLMSSMYIRWLIVSCDFISLYPLMHFLICDWVTLSLSQ